MDIGSYFNSTVMTYFGAVTLSFRGIIIRQKEIIRKGSIMRKKTLIFINIIAKDVSHPENKYFPFGHGMVMDFPKAIL